jgi:hypothetical protein
MAVGLTAPPTVVLKMHEAEILAQAQKAGLMKPECVVLTEPENVGLRKLKTVAVSSMGVCAKKGGRKWGGGVSFRWVVIARDILAKEPSGSNS